VVYYPGENQQLYYDYLTGGTWNNYELAGDAAASNSTPNVLRDESSGDQWVYYLDASGASYYWWLIGPNWNNYVP
jgi:hypothetical protein